MDLLILICVEALILYYSYAAINDDNAELWKILVGAVGMALGITLALFILFISIAGIGCQ